MGRNDLFLDKYAQIFQPCISACTSAANSDTKHIVASLPIFSQAIAVRSQISAHKLQVFLIHIMHVLSEPAHHS
ncbi:hypothetical protein GS682_17985 [Nostoc sp. B(2019)]|nr:hypothetical protein [Nostoc sp. B(2019)]